MTERTVRPGVLRGSAARAPHERHGCTEERPDPIDVFMVRAPARWAVRVHVAHP